MSWTWVLQDREESGLTPGCFDFCGWADVMLLPEMKTAGVGSRGVRERKSSSSLDM